MITREQVAEIVKALPADKLSSAYDYLRFLQHQTEFENWPYDAAPAAMVEDDAAWDERLKTDKSQRFMAQMAAEVRAEYITGQTEPLEELLDDDEAADDEVTLTTITCCADLATGPSRTGTNSSYSPARSSHITR